jgi:hypothetical protein
MNGKLEATARAKIGTHLALFLLAFLWFWFWRPYGFYGGDSEFLDRQIGAGFWFRKREPLAVAAMQLCHQLTSPLWGWPVSWAISLASCLAGAAAVVILWKLCRGRENARLTFALTLASGYSLLFHGSVESYALPTCLLAVWILAIRKIEEGKWPAGWIGVVFAAMAWCHTMALCLVPALALTAWLHRDTWRKDAPYWSLGFLLAVGLYVFTDVLHIGEGAGFDTLPQMFRDSGPKEYGPLLSLKHIEIKACFLWLATHLTLPAALAWVWKKPHDAETIQIAALSACALAFLVLFHPDAGYFDWDLFLFPSLPVAVLAARFVAASPRRNLFAAVWVTAFLSLWLPRIPVWAQLRDRGLAEVTLLNVPNDRRILLDDRHPVATPTFKVQGGWHTVSLLKHGERTRWKAFEAVPGRQVNLRLPEGSVAIQPASR